MTPRKALAAPR